MMQDLDFTYFIDHRERCAASAGVEDEDGKKRSLHQGDLALTYACLSGDPRAMKCFEQIVREAVGRAVRQFREDAFVQDEISQALLCKFLMPGRGDVHPLSTFHGTAPLCVWLKSAAIRALLNHRVARRKFDAHVTEEQAAQIPETTDPEMAYLQERYGDEFRVAFREALNCLDTEERNLIVLYFFHHLTVGKIAQIKRTHKSTAARWVEKARTRLAHDLRKRLRRQFAFSEHEVNSWVRSVRSRLVVDLDRLISQDPHPA